MRRNDGGEETSHSDRWTIPAVKTHVSREFYDRLEKSETNVANTLAEFIKTGRTWGTTSTDQITESRKHSTREIHARRLMMRVVIGIMMKLARK